MPAPNLGKNQSRTEPEVVALDDPDRQKPALFEDVKDIALLLPEEVVGEPASQPQMSTVQGFFKTTDKAIAPPREPSPTSLTEKLFGGQYLGLKIAAWVLLGIWIIFAVFLTAAQRWHWIIPCAGVRSKLIPIKAPVSGHIAGNRSQAPIQSVPSEANLSSGAAVCDPESDARRLDEVIGSFSQEVILAATPQEVARLVGKDPARRPRNVHILSEWTPRLG